MALARKINCSEIHLAYCTSLIFPYNLGMEGPPDDEPCFCLCVNQRQVVFRLNDSVTCLTPVQRIASFPTTSTTITSCLRGRRRLPA